MLASLQRSRGPLALAIALALSAGGADAATIAVTAGGDNGTGATCTLRQAIATMVAESLSFTACLNSGDAFGTNDTILFDGSLKAATITLVGGVGKHRLVVEGLAAPLTIQGSGQTIDANKQSLVLGAQAVTLTLSNVTLTGGLPVTDCGFLVYPCPPYRSVGAGLSVQNSTVTLNNVAVSGNSNMDGTHLLYGGGIYADNSVLTLNNSSVSDNFSALGAGLFAGHSTLTLTNSTVSGNSALSAGGGVFLTGSSTLTLTSSTVSGNIAANLFGSAGGLYVDQSTAFLINSTISNNYGKLGAGGVYITSSSAGAQNSLVEFFNCTISGNSTGGIGIGSGIYAGSNSSLAIFNTILAGNISASSSDLVGTGQVTAWFSLLGMAEKTFAFFVSNQNVFSDAPGLSPLANNGGPTQTMALTDNSPALNAGIPGFALDPTTQAPLTYDQRGPGFPRSLGGNVDIGAYQHQPGDRVMADGFESAP